MKSAINTSSQQQLQKLQLLFHEQLPVKLHDIEIAFDAFSATPENKPALDLLYRLIHNLAGTAGTFGAKQITQQALLLDKILKPLLEQTEAASKEILDTLAEHLTITRHIASQWDPKTSNPLFNRDQMQKDGRDNNLIFIVEDDALLAQQLIDEFETCHYEVQHFPNTSAFLDAYKNRVPGIIIMDMVFAEGEYAGAEVLKTIAQPDTLLPPVIFISVRDDMEARLAAQRAGATRYFTKPLDITKLHASIDGLTNHHIKDPFRVLIIDDDEMLSNYYSEVMEIAGIKTRVCNHPMQALETIEAFQPELILLDIYMPEVTGLEVAAVIRQDDHWAQTPLVFLSSETNLDKQLAAMHLGGDDFLTKPVDAEHLIASITARVKRSRWVNRLNADLKFALQEIEYRQIALDQHSIVSVTDTQGNITDINHKFMEISGYSRAELIGQNHRMLNSGTHPKPFFEDMWATIARGEVWHGEVCNRSKNGSLYWVEATLVPFLDDQGLPYKYVAIRTDITALMETQQALHRSEKNFRSIFNNFQDIFYRVDMDGHITMISPSVEKLTQYTVSELMGQPVESFYANPADRDQLLQAMQANQGSIENHEVQLVHKDGKLFYGSVNSHFILDQQGEFAGIEGTIRDITASKAAKHALEESESRLKRSQEFANIGTWDWNIKTSELFWSERIGPLFGYQKSVPETTYKNFINAIHPDDRDKVTAAVTACVEEGKEYNIEHRVIWDDGSVHWMLESGDVIRDANGAPLHMLGVVQDITQRKQLETTLRDQRELLTLLRTGMTEFVATTNFQSVAEFLLLGVCKLTHSQQGFIGEVLYDAANKPYLKTHAFSGLETTNTNNDFYDNSLAEGLIFTNLDNLIGASIKEGTVVISNVPESDPRKGGLPEGHPPLQNYIGIPIFYGTELVGLYGLSNNENDFTPEMVDFLRPFNVTYGSIIHAKRIADSETKVKKDLLIAKEEAEQANRAKSQFLSSMSHELRTPMNAILGFGQLLEMNALNSEQQDYVAEILKAGNHLLELINEVLDLAKIESGRLELSIESICFDDILAECRSLLNPMLQQHGITLESDTSACDQIYVHADSVRLKQIMINLLSNAVKYNRPQGSINITCQLEANNTSVRINIIDTGIGLSTDAQTRLFTPFTRIDDDKHNIEGTGIGLVITKNLLKLMEGAIGVESEQGVGSTFWFTLPLANDVSSGLSDEQTDEVIGTGNSALTNTQQRYTIIYIEDNPTNLRLVQQVLSRWPHIQLLSAHEPKLGLDLIKAHHPNLVLLDINLPGMDGYEVLARLQADSEVKHIPVIAVSANAMPGDIERGNKAGFSDYITKPIQVANFLTAISNFLELPLDETNITRK